MTAALDRSRRAVACKGWRWLPRMAATHLDVSVHDTEERRLAPSPRRVGPSTVMRVDSQYIEQHGGCLVVAVTTHDHMRYVPLGWGDALPDLNDPATLGCIEHGLLPELYGEVGGLWQSTTGWHYGPSGISWGSGPTKADALLAALEAAP